MRLYNDLPIPSDRMGLLWTLGAIRDICIVEYGPAGTTHYALESLMQLNAELRAGLYTTDLDETEVVLGDTGRLAETVREVDRTYRPAVIAVVGSALAAVVGADLAGVCRELQPALNARLIVFDSGGFQGDYPVGIGSALRVLAETVVRPPEQKEARTYNIIGGTIDHYNFAADHREIARMIERAFGFRLQAVFTAESSLAELEKAGEARFNLVLRSEGLTAAAILKERYGQPYWAGCPYGLRGSADWLEGLGELLGCKPDSDYLAEEQAALRRLIWRSRVVLAAFGKLPTVLAGAYDFLAELAPFVAEELGLDLRALIVNHRLAGDYHRELSRSLQERLLVSDEELAIAALLETEPQVILGDGMLLARSGEAPLKIQVANPNLERILVYEFTPLVGFRGAAYLIELLLNGVQARRGRRPAGF